MKKVCALLIVLVLAMTVVPATAFTYETLNIEIDGALVDIPEDYGAVMIVDNRTMVPVRFISEILGFSVAWDNQTQIVMFGNYANSVIVRIGANVIENTMTGEVFEMDAAAMLYDNRTYIPIRFFAYAVGMGVSWDEDTQTVGLYNLADGE